MSVKRRPPDTFYKRSTYKTEFDIFKQRSQLDLISLLSFDDNDTANSIEDAKNIHARNRPLYEKASTSNKTGKARRGLYVNNRAFVRSRQWIEYKRQGIEPPLRRGRTENNERACKSAFGATTRVQKPHDVTRDTRLRSKSSYTRKIPVESVKTVSKTSPNANESNVTKKEDGSVSSTISDRRTKSAGVRVASVNSPALRKRTKTAVISQSARNNAVAGKQLNNDLSTGTSSKNVQTICPCGHDVCSKNCQRRSCLTSPSLVGSILKYPNKSGVFEQDSSKRVNSSEDLDSEPSWITGDYKGTRSPEDSLYDADNADIYEEIPTINLRDRDSGFCSKTTSPDTKHHRVAIDEQNTHSFQTIAHKCVSFDIDEFEVSSNEHQSDTDEVNQVEIDHFEKYADKDKSVGCDAYAEFISDLKQLESGVDNVDQNFSDTEGVVDVLDDIHSLNVDLSSIESDKDNVPVELDHDESPEDDSVKETSTTETSMSGLTDRKMSKEARHAIFETLQDMRLASKRERKSSSVTDPILHQGVTAKRRLDNNRQQYKYYLRERSNTLIRTKTVDSDELVRVRETTDRLYDNDNDSSTGITDTQARLDVKGHNKCSGPLLPSIDNNGKANNQDGLVAKSKVYTLDHVKKRKYKIPGIGNYNFVSSPDQEFEITPVGFDSRYNVGPAISEAERDTPPRFIQDQSINKCKKWLKNVSLSPLSLKPAKSSKASIGR